jgi:cysteine desulfurase / selenocysteine lyase
MSRHWQHTSGVIIMSEVDIKKDFPIFSSNSEFKGQPLIYLDNAASAQKPQTMIDALTHYYTHINSNIGRSVYKLAEKSSEAFELTRKAVAQFINTKKRNIIFTSGATASLNLAAHLAQQAIIERQKNHVGADKLKIVLSIVEHHANILPWQRIARDYNVELVYIDSAQQLAHPEELPETFWHNVAVVALTHVSNVTGQIHPVSGWCSLARQYGALSVIDGAQGVTTVAVNVNDIGCDFYAFSAHKLYGPMGVGVLYIHDQLMAQYEPLVLGGGTIEDVLAEEFFLLSDYSRYEAGTPNVADVAAFRASLEYLTHHDWPQLLEQTHRVGDYLQKQIRSHADFEVLEIENSHLLPHSHTISFKIKDIHAHDVGTFLSNMNIAVRVGKHCAHPLHYFLDSQASIRASVGIYNTNEDVDKLIEGLTQCMKFFRSR